MITRQPNATRKPAQRALLGMGQAIFLIWVLMAGRTEAAELEGFGPVKFGMTKDEAWEAIGGKGSWDYPDLLSYEVRTDVPEMKTKINQSFKDGRAATFLMRIEPAKTSFRYCLVQGTVSALMIQTMHGVPPIIREGHPTNWIGPIESPGTSTIKDVYIFTFDRAAYIELTATSIDTPQCWIEAWYYPPSTRPIPF